MPVNVEIVLTRDQAQLLEGILELDFSDASKMDGIEMGYLKKVIKLTK